MRWALLLVIAALSPLGIANEKWQRTVRHIAPAGSAPKIDGTLDDPCWKTATHVDGFFRFQSKEAVHERTEAWLCADKNRLYLGFYCHDTQPNLIRAHETQREGDLSHDDRVGIIIDSQSTRRNCSQFFVSALGTQLTQLEGGTATNLTWAGDWKAASKRLPDGWTAEMSIPFSLLRYPKGAKSFAIALYRQMARESNGMSWPAVPPEGFNDPLHFLDDFDGIEPPTYAPRLVALPYVLGTAGGKASLKGGLDLKYPISTSMTGVATLFPDFATVEQAVQDLSFSYTEKFLPDRRPFFAEGADFLNDPYLFYSQRIPGVDAGAKVTGKQGNTTVSFLGTTADTTGQSAFVGDVSQDIGKYSKVGVAVLGNNTDGVPSNRVYQVNGNYGWMEAGRQSNVTGNYTGSTQSDGTQDHASYLQLNTDGGRGNLSGNAYLSHTGPNFSNQLGYVPEVNVDGKGMTLFYYNTLDRGSIERINGGVSAVSVQHDTGGFFHDSMSLFGNVRTRSGQGYTVSADIGKRDAFKDNTVSAGYAWNQKNLFERGGLNYSIGHRSNLPYSFLSVNQGLLVMKRFSLNLTLGRSTLGAATNTQTILTGTYRLNAEETFGARALQQNSDVNVYFSYGRRMPHGTDVFLILGDPNSTRVRGVLTLKLVRPL